MTFVVNEHTAAVLKQCVAQPSHAILLSGPAGSGKYALAEQLAADLLQTRSLQDYPYKLIITPESSTTAGISIEDIRGIEHLLSLRVPKTQAVNRVIIIQDAHLMTREAQNAILKTLEEPPQGTVIILTGTSGQSLLATIRSRVQTIAVQAPTGQQLNDYFTNEGYAPTDITRAYSMTGGLPGLMTALLASKEHPLRAATDTARALLGESNYERLARVEALSKDKPLAIDTLFIMQQMAHVSLKTAEGKAAERWQKVLTAAYDATTLLNQSANQKLVLTKLMLSL